MDTHYGITDELINEERELENGAATEGITKYYQKHNEAEEKMVFAPELKRLKREIPLLSHAISTALRQAGRAAAIKKRMLSGIHPDQLALLTIRHCFNHYLGDQTIQKLARSLMTDIRIHKDDLRFKEAYPAYRAVIMRNLKSDHQGYRHKVLTHSRHKRGITDTKWPDNHKIIVGTFLIDLYCLTCGSFYKDDFQKKNRWYSQDRKKMVKAYGVTIRPTQKTLDWLDKNHEFCSKLAPVLKPMVVPPKDWVDPWNGGYISVARQHNSSCRFVRRVSNGWLEKNKADIDPKVYEAVNRIQATPYRLNKKVLAVMRKLTGTGLAGLPDDKPVKLQLPPDLSPQQAKNEARLKAHKIQKAEIYARYYKAIAQKTAHSERMRMAHMFSDKQAFWFPMNLDWRGRLFTMASPFLSPQGDDPAKGLLEFAEGKEITAEGFIEMQIHGANVYGEDKLS
jgi:DNA-directed RNA polymerase